MRYIFLINLILTINTSTCLAFSKSADEMYKDLIKSEYKNSLPSYIKDAKPETSEDNSDKKIKNLSHIEAVEQFNNEITISQKRYPIDNNSKSWNDIVKSVASGYPSAFDINEIKILTENNDPAATELLAWMYAYGVGVNKNLNTSWFLYMKATSLEVENAKENAELIYKSMTPEQKNKLLSY